MAQGEKVIQIEVTSTGAVWALTNFGNIYQRYGHHSWELQKGPLGGGERC